MRLHNLAYFLLYFLPLFFIPNQPETSKVNVTKFAVLWLNHCKINIIEAFWL